jgi:hypothetical protein
METSHKESILTNINARIEYLIKNAFNKAKERIDLISEKTSEVKAPTDTDSSGASEARKYAGVVSVNNYLGIDIIAELNRLSEGRLVFPTVDQLSENTDYISRSLVNAKKFIDKALSITSPYLDFKSDVRWSIDFSRL